MNIVNNTKFNSFDEIGGKNSSRVYLREINKKGVHFYKLSKTNFPTLKKIEHSFKDFFSRNTIHYWHGKEKVMKQLEKKSISLFNDASAETPVEEIKETPHEQMPHEETPPKETQVSPPIKNQTINEQKADDAYPGFEKYYLNYSFQLAGSQLMTSLGIWNWFDKVVEHKNGASLFLGALPLKPGTFREQDGEIFKEFKSKGIGAILTAVEPFENHSVGYLHSAVTPQDWKDNGFDQLQIPTEDYGTIPMEEIEKGVAYIRSMLENGKGVYVHCKAGKGRSLLLVACYLIKYHQMTADQALDYVKVKRVQSGFDAVDKKRDSVLAFQAKWGR